MIWEQAVYLNLADATERKTALEARLAAVGIEATRIEAVAAPFAAGCTQSHLLAARAAVTANKTTLVLEDDAAFHKDFAAKLALVEAQLPAVWDMLYLGRFWQAGRPISDNLQKLWGGRGHHGYVIHKDFAPKWVDVMGRLAANIDDATGIVLQRGFQILTTSPILVVQEPNVSTNFPGRVQDFIREAGLNPDDYAL